MLVHHPGLRLLLHNLSRNGLLAAYRLWMAKKEHGDGSVKMGLLPYTANAGLFKSRATGLIREAKQTAAVCRAGRRYLYGRHVTTQ